MKQFLLFITLVFAALFLAPLCADAAPAMIGEIANSDFTGAALATGAGLGLATIADLKTIDFSQIKSFTQQEFEELKVKHGKVYILTIDDEGDIYHFAAIRPDRNLMAAIGDYATKGDINKVNDLLIKNLIKLGDKNKLEDGIIYLTIVEQLGKLVEPAKSFLNKG